jgi:uncharacterized protein (DUF362 family)/Pyruvate/2-oxoacid:ferredoxin oxidoreductase delta subunit
LHQIQTNKNVVSVISCDNYNIDKVRSVIAQSLNNIGGLGQYVQPGAKVHIKPNLLAAKTPEQAVTTHPTLIEAIAEQLFAIGAEVTIGDSPAGSSRPIEYYWDKTGLSAVAQRTGAQLVKFERNGVVEKKINGNSYYIAKKITEADVVINLPKMKTHGLTLFTGAIKNMFGSIPGATKAEFHKKAPKVKDFSRIIVDIFQATQPQLNIMDGIDIMDGNGPSSGDVKKFGYILASQDAVALDTIAAYMMGINIDEVLPIQIAYERGLGNKNLDQIEIVGITRNLVKPHEFQLPVSHFASYIPQIFLNALVKLVWHRPKAITDKCQKCGLCIANCPVKAMSSVDGIPDIDYSVCIKCFCCDEICPHNAIEQQMSWIAKKLR